MKYIPLNIKSGYSFFHSCLKIEDIISYASQNKINILCLTDKNVMFGVMPFAHYCLSKNIKYIIGIEIKILKDDQVSSLILYAKNILGYKNLCRLSSFVSKDNKEYIIPIEQLEDYLEGIIIIIPSLRSIIYEMYLKNDSNKILEFLNFFKAINKETFLGLEYYGIENLDFLNYLRSLDFEKCVINEVRYLKNSDENMLDVLFSIENHTTLNYTKKYNYALDNDQFIFSNFNEDEIKMNENIANMINLNIFELKTNLIKYQNSLDDVSNKDYFKALCYKGLQKRLNNKMYEEYQLRLEYEISVIEKMGFIDYFLIVWDYIKFAKKKNILVGPGRGSAAGSLVSYVLGITNVDPIKYKLLFERFLNPQRVTMPDIDIDIANNRIDEVIDYIFQKYGKDHSAKVITFATFGTKQAIMDASKVMGLSEKEGNIISKHLPLNIRERSGKDTELGKIYENNLDFQKFINSRNKYHQVYDVALKLLGLPRQSSYHASAIVLSKEKLSDVMPIYINNGVISTQYDMNYLEDIGLLKMDLLKLQTLVIIEDCLFNIKKRHGIDIDINNINLNDKKIYELINTTNTNGIFQLESPGMKRAIKTVKPNSFEDLVAILALFRPGPMDFIDTYARRKNYNAKIDYIDECLKSILEPTYGIMIYQEQIMQVLQMFAGFSLGEADIIRRAIAKKDEKELLRQKESFTSRAMKKGHSLQSIDKVFELILKFANYGFNRSHSVAYAMIAVQMAYLKLHYQEEFYCSCMSQSNIFKFIDELKEQEIRILPPSINKSMVDLSIEDSKQIRLSFNNIQGIGEVAISSILEARKEKKFNDFLDFMERVYLRGVTKDQVLNLIYSGCFDEFKINRTTLASNLDNIAQYISIILVRKDSNIQINTLLSDRPIVHEYSDDEEDIIRKEFSSLGMVFSSSIFTKYRKKLYEQGCISLKECKKKKISVKSFIYAQDIRFMKTKNGEEMAIINGFDETAKISLIIFPNVYKKYKNILSKNNYFYVAGDIKSKNQDISFIVNDLKIFKNGGSNDE
ncbi:MAG: DNA polymerase III subunit alpha [Bacilli bacterium]